MANHFEFHGEVSKKGDLFRNLKGMFEFNGENVFQVLPLTYTIKIALDKPAYSIKQQLTPFRYVYKLLDEFKKVFDTKTE